MAHIHEGSVSSTYLTRLENNGWTHKCKSCGESTGRVLRTDVKPHLCGTCSLIEKRDSKLNALLNKKWWEIWK
jgi:hypothetical protein